MSVAAGAPRARPAWVAGAAEAGATAGPVAYLTSRYPAVSHTFILHEVRALRRLGMDVRTFSVRRVGEDELITDADRAEAAQTEAILPTGAVRVVRAQLRALCRSPRRYLATLVTALRLSPGGLRGAVWQLFYFAEAVLFLQACRRQGAAHVHAHFANTAADVALLAAELDRREARTGLTWSFTMHGSTEFYDVRRYNLAAKVERAAFVLCVSRFTRSQLMLLADEAHWPKLHLTPCGVDLDRFSPAPARDRVDGALRVLTVSRLVRGKGLTLMIAAIGRLRARGVPAELTVVGDGPERSRLEAQTEALGLRGVVTFVGALGQDEVRARYAQADVFCMSSFAEGVPVVLMEAMAMEVPVVTTSVMGIPELVQDGVSGLLVPPGVEPPLTEALERLARDPVLRRRLGRAGRLAVQAEHDLAACADRIHAVMRGRMAAAGRSHR